MTLCLQLTLTFVLFFAQGRIAREFYKALALGAPLSPEDSWQAFRVSLFLMGHSFDYIDSLNLEDVGLITSYQYAKAKAEEKAAKKRQRAQQSQRARGRKRR